MSGMSRRGLFGLFGRGDVAAPAVVAPVVPDASLATPAAGDPARPANKPVGRPRPGPMRPGRAGTFAISEQHCIAWKGTSCSTCRERCPVAGALSVVNGRPTIDAAVCTGCGDCVAVCPAPILAIRFVAQKVSP